MAGVTKRPVALVTGARRGIGAAIALALAKDGFDVCVTDISEDEDAHTALAASNIAVFEVRPGVIRTPMTAGVAGKFDQRIADGLVPMDRWGEPEDIGNAVAVLASGRLAFATGSVINLDGGLAIPRL